WWEHGPLYGFGCFFCSVDRGNHNDHGACVHGTLELALGGFSDTNARDGRSIGAFTIHRSNRFPVGLLVLHFDPDEVVAGVSHGAVNARIVRANGAAEDVLTGKQLLLGGVPDLNFAFHVITRTVVKIGSRE